MRFRIPKDVQSETPIAVVPTLIRWCEYAELRVSGFSSLLMFEVPKKFFGGHSSKAFPSPWPG